MNKNLTLFAALALCFALVIGGTAYALNEIQPHPEPEASASLETTAAPDAATEPVRTEAPETTAAEPDEGLAAAKAIALEYAGVSAEDATFLRADGAYDDVSTNQLIYEIWFLDADGIRYEIGVDAATGSVLEMIRETPAPDYALMLAERYPGFREEAYRQVAALKAQCEEGLRFTAEITAEKNELESRKTALLASVGGDTAALTPEAAVELAQIDARLKEILLNGDLLIEYPEFYEYDTFMIGQIRQLRELGLRQLADLEEQSQTDPRYLAEVKKYQAGIELYDQVIAMSEAGTDPDLVYLTYYNGIQ